MIRLHSFAERFIVEPIDLTELDALDNVYTSSRYPADIGLIATGKPSPTESKELYENAKQIFKIILQAIE